MEPVPIKDLDIIFSKYIDVFFSLTTSMGLMQFARSSFFSNLLNDKKVDYRLFLLFLSTLVFVVNDWIVYHLVTKELPYTGATSIFRFWFDVLAFGLMYISFYISTQDITLKQIKIYISTICSWHFLIFWWYFMSGTVKTPHIIRFFSFLIIVITASQIRKSEPTENQIQKINTYLSVLCACSISIFSIVRILSFLYTGRKLTQYLFAVEISVLAIILIICLIVIFKFSKKHHHS